MPDILPGFFGTATAQEQAFTAYDTEAPFADVAADVSDAIINRGYVVDHHGLISQTARTDGR